MVTTTQLVVAVILVGLQCAGYLTVALVLAIRNRH